VTPMRGITPLRHVRANFLAAALISMALPWAGFPFRLRVRPHCGAGGMANGPPVITRMEDLGAAVDPNGGLLPLSEAGVHAAIGEAWPLVVR
jgi:hypothetical protein